MLEILRDQIWQSVGAFLGLVAIIVSIVLWRTQRQRKALSFDIITFPTLLLSVADEVKGKLQILFDGKPIQNVYLVSLKIINSGNVPIVSADYVCPISFSFGELAQILTAEITETNPDNLQASVSIEATRVALEPILLNGGDSITLKFLVSQLDEINIDGRIVGVKDIRKLMARRIEYLFLVLGAMLGGFVLFIGGLLFKEIYLVSLGAIVTISGVVISLILGFVAFLWGLSAYRQPP